MTHFICSTCGAQQADSPQPPRGCIICEDERQWVPKGGPVWTTLEEMRAKGYRNEVRDLEAGLTGLFTRPQVGIGQWALLVQTPWGNVLWDSISYIDDATIAAVDARGGVQAIAISHPHFYSSMVEWSRAFGGAPIYLHRDDQEFIVRPDPAVRLWEGPELTLGEGVTLVHIPGHTPGSAGLHWAAGAGGRGAFLTADAIQVVRTRRHVSFMYSYPNYIPLSPAVVRRTVETVNRYAYDRVYGINQDLVIEDDARRAVEESAARYIRMVQQEG